MPKLLLVDDEKDLVNSLREDLIREGFTVLTATDGPAALEKARKEQPQIMLLDLMLPSLDGYRILKLLKSDERYRHIKILVITAKADPQDLTLAMECGADGCLVKPVAFEVLLNRIRTLANPNEANGHSSDGNEHGSAKVE